MWGDGPRTETGTLRSEGALKPVYFVNAPVDVALIGGLSIAAAAALWAVDHAGIEIPATSAAVLLGWIINWPHFAATGWRLYGNRDGVRQYPATAVAVPFLVVAGIAASFASPDVAAPAFVKLFVLWSPFHFSGQTLGLCLLYARRAGWTLGKLDRAALVGFVYATYVNLIARQETDIVPGRFDGLSYPHFGIPEWIPWATQGATHTFGFFAVVLFARACLLQRRLLPPIILLPAVAQSVWFAAGPLSPSFNLFVPLFHALQYLLIAWAVQLKERRAAAAPSWRFLLRETAVWVAGMVVAGGLLFWGLPRLAVLAGLSPWIGQPVLSAAVQIHHFFVDGVIWKLRHPKVAGALDAAFPEFVRPTAVREGA